MTQRRVQFIASDGSGFEFTVDPPPPHDIAEQVVAAINARLAHESLTIDQVREVIESVLRQFEN